MHPIRELEKASVSGRGQHPILLLPIHIHCAPAYIARSYLRADLLIEACERRLASNVPVESATLERKWIHLPPESMYVAAQTAVGRP